MTDQERFEHGRKLFNRRDFFECHDVWEVLWMDSRGAEKALYQGLIQVAVAYYHAGNRNFRGAANLMHKGTHKLLAHVADPRIDLATALPQFVAHGNLFATLVQHEGRFDPSDIPRL